MRGPAMGVVAAVLVGALAGSAMAFELSSTAFAPGATIPVRHTCDGADVSPPLAWTSPPTGTKAFALLCEDPDAPRGLWVHWVLWGVPATARSLPEGVKPQENPADGSRHGRNDFDKVGYKGPCPPPGAPHRYVFRLYALDAVPELDPGGTRAQLLDAIRGHVLGEADLTGRYGRS